MQNDPLPVLIKPGGGHLIHASLADLFLPPSCRGSQIPLSRILDTRVKL
jgi:hypothetical protein